MQYSLEQIRAGKSCQRSWLTQGRATPPRFGSAPPEVVPCGNTSCRLRSSQLLFLLRLSQADFRVADQFAEAIFERGICGPARSERRGLPAMVAGSAC